MITIFLIVFTMIIFMALALSLGQILKKKPEGESCIASERAQEESHTCGLCSHFGPGGCLMQRR